MAGPGYSITQAAIVSMLAVAMSAAVGTTMAWKHSYVRYLAASLMAIVGTLFAPPGIRLATALPFVAGAILGMVLGRRVAPLIAGPALQKGFAATAGIIALAMAFKAGSAP